MRILAGVMTATVVAMTILGCAPKAPVVGAAAVEDKAYPVTPAALAVRAGIVTGEFADIQVVERVEAGTGRVDAAAKLTGTLKLKNGSTDQTLRLIGGRFRFIDGDGREIALEASRSEPSFKLSSYGGNDRLDPGQDATQAVSVDFPTAALKAKKLKEIRLELTYLPSAYKQETANLAVSIGGQ